MPDLCFVEGMSEALALAAGLLILEVEGLTRPLLFCTWGCAPRILLPVGWTGRMRDAAIVERVSALCSAVRTEEERVAMWREAVRRAVGPAEWALVDASAAG